ncbi:MAG: cytochrome c oxidase subunit 3 [Verrucomicrobiales bacterium]
MEIPYEVTARPDTGLWNAKVGIWLFLASEVMLFGGLFSSYVFLRLGADYPWPVHELTVLPGFINTLVLIASSVTVVFSWAFLKMRRYRPYQICMAVTIGCALTFMVIKAIEYTGKFTHWAIRLKDGSVIDGHKPHDKIQFGDVKAVNINFETAESDFLDFSSNKEARFKLADGRSIELSGSLIRELRSNSRAARKAADKRISHLSEDLRETRNPQKRKEIEAKLEAAKQERNKIRTGERLLVEGPPLAFAADRRSVRSYLTGELTFTDNTRLEGKLIDDSIKMEASGYDLRQVKGLRENLDAADNSMVWKYFGQEKRHEFLEHKKKTLAEFQAKHPNHKPAETGEFMRESYKHEPHGHDAPHLEVTVPSSEIRYYSNYSPHLNTYYAIYFLMTGLHGLHVVGGALVLSYFLLFGRKLYERNPEHLANRVEVGGLFWHFVDLVWIFLFPVFYLL